MRTIKKHRVIFYSPGTFFAETENRDIESCDPKLAVKMAEQITARHGAKPYGFCFETYITHDPIPDGMGGVFTPAEKSVKKSGTYFLGGVVESYDEVSARATKAESVLLSNMRGNQWWYIITNTNSYRTTMPFTEEDVVVDAAGNIIERGNDHARVAYRGAMNKRTPG